MLIGLQLIMMFFYLYQHLNRGMTEGFAVAELLCVLIAGVCAWEWREASKPATPATA
jgi:hypothetical protein